MSIEAMTLALEALENVTKDYVESRQYKHNKAITALNAAIEAAEKQKPVAWAVFEGWNAHDLYLPQEYDEALKMAGYKGDHAEVKPLYTHPSAAQPAPAPGYCKHCKQYTIEEPLPAVQRQWVGLTDEEINEWTPEIHGVIQAIEAKLKEKNT
jgi:hypothetical protein